MKLASCFRIGCRVPSFISNLSLEMKRFENPLGIAYDSLLDLFAELCDFRASARGSANSDSISIVSALLAFDKSLKAWANELPSGWNYRTVFTSDCPDEIYEDTYHVYPTSMIAITWNVYRSMRIFVQSGVLQQLKRLNYECESPTSLWLRKQRVQSQAIISEMAFDICASIPDQLGYGKPNFGRAWFHPPAGPAVFLLAPIHIAVSWMGVPRSMKEYVTGRMRYIGHALGFQEALLAADIVQTTIDATSLEAMKNEAKRQKRCSKDVINGRGNMVGEIDEIASGFCCAEI